MPPILVVDDDANVAELVALVMEEDGHQVDTALGGQAALERLARRAYALIVCDLHMPGVDGRAVYEALHHQPGPHPPVLFVSGHRDAEQYRSFLEEHAFSILPKPFTVDALREAVRRLLGGDGGPERSTETR